MHQLDNISNKLDIIIKLMAHGAVKDKNFDDKIFVLSNMGFDNSAIAQITGAKATTIKTRKSQLKTKKKK